MSEKYDVVVVGAGPGGYVAAIRAAQMGLNTLCVEKWVDDKGKSRFGGTCLNVGCIPSKALLHVARVIQEAREVEESGIGFGAPQINVDKVRAFKEGVISKLVGGVGELIKARKVNHVQARASFVDSKTLELTGASGAGVTTTRATCRPMTLACG